MPEDFSQYRLKDIFILSIRGNDGNFRALYEMPNKLNKSIFFKFKIDAKVNVLVAIKDIDRDHILNLSDYEQRSVSLKEYDKEALKETPKNIKLITRTRIKRGKILTNRQFKTLSDIKKGDLVNAVLKDGTLNIEVSVTALEDGSVGDIIQVRNENNQVFKANVISKNRVLIR
ncbi:flagellar basal body P-ring formation chaperone FlgA [Campylobacter fetus]|uniref:flagellar basal body P-ring formation chaperone FlgA n=1 Tax=Campylobacter fetus TaxID=196 RepID=UPI000818A3D3|nr:flagellar basal body P-ring formation chaperone FlgA [Campylobacter fetus]AGZ81752.2 flagellar basal body P-ring biosynthesis protein [Campylobacter fetus subsp. testudinum 03-427]OCS01262.1 flagella basal body P-ring formation protein FlgA [Campylobacter fetus subsp. testudinum]UEA64568.1 flagellar basal body P-ring formation chaperone FlgA [Campylobacter fetus subsp. testudinum]